MHLTNVEMLQPVANAVTGRDSPSNVHGNEHYWEEEIFPISKLDKVAVRGASFSPNI